MTTTASGHYSVVLCWESRRWRQEAWDLSCRWQFAWASDLQWERKKRKKGSVLWLLWLFVTVGPGRTRKRTWIHFEIGANFLASLFSELIFFSFSYVQITDRSMAVRQPLTNRYEKRIKNQRKAHGKESKFSPFLFLFLFLVLRSF